jgi:hypothetical protein
MKSSAYLLFGAAGGASVRCLSVLFVALVAASCASHAGSDRGSTHPNISTTTEATSTPQSSKGWVRFADDPDRSGVSFLHPRAWPSKSYDVFMDASGSDPITYLSNVPLHDPCSALQHQQLAWDDPLARLGAGGVFVGWYDDGIALSGPGYPANTTVNDVPAYLGVEKPGSCSRFGAQETVLGVLMPRGRGNVSMRACLRGPGLSQNEARVREMFASARLQDSAAVDRSAP